MKLLNKIITLIPRRLVYWLQGARIKSRGLCSFGKNSFISKGTRIIVSDLLNYNRKDKFIIIGKNCWIGEWAEIQSVFNSKIIIKDYSTIQDYCKILGDVTIEKYCVFAPNIFISSGNHYATVKPEWLIREQDDFVFSTESGKKEHSKPVHIEEDCWLGWGVFIKPGIYIGRGAVIGAYSIITKNVPPYSIQIGSPNKEIKNRLFFDPPTAILPSQSTHLPYFYRGFGHKRFEMEESLKSGIIYSEKQSLCVVKKIKYKSLVIEGVIFKKTIEETNLEISISGYKVIATKIIDNNFNIAFELTEDKNSIHKYLEEQYTVVQFHLSGNFLVNRKYNWGLSKIALQV